MLTHSLRTVATCSLPCRIGNRKIRRSRQGRNTVDHRTLISPDHMSVPDRCSIAKVERRTRIIPGEASASTWSSEKKKRCVAGRPPKTRGRPSRARRTDDERRKDGTSRAVRRKRKPQVSADTAYATCVQSLVCHSACAAHCACVTHLSDCVRLRDASYTAQCVSVVSARCPSCLCVLFCGRGVARGLTAPATASTPGHYLAQSAHRVGGRGGGGQV